MRQRPRWQRGDDTFVKEAQCQPMQQPDRHMDSKGKHSSGKTSEKSVADAKASTAVLSCARCHHRKIKCDKSEGGCSNCQKAGVQCQVINRARLPRGRKGVGKKTDSDWKARLVKLEQLLKSYAQDTVPPANEQRTNSVSEELLVDFSGQDNVQNVAAAGDLSKYLGSTFWISLSKEITHIREILDDSSEDECEEYRHSPPTTDSSGPSPFGNIITGQTTFLNGPSALEFPDIPTASALCEVFLYRFSPLMKIGHGPTLRRLVCGQPYLDYHADHIAPKLLRWAIYYAGVQTLDDAECQQNFGTDKHTMASKYRAATEYYLARADLMRTSDLTVLESFLIYIAALRAEDSSRQCWTLTAIAVRIGQAVGLHLDDTHLRLKPFHIQMRRRLWHALRISDVRTAYDRGTAPIIATEHCTVAAPLNINDADLSMDMDNDDGDLDDRPEYTDMTHSLICLAGSGLKNVPSSAIIERFQPSLDIPGGGAPAWNQDKAHQLCQYLEGKYLQHFDLRIDMQWYTRLVAASILSMNVLFSARPLQRSSRTPGTPSVSGDELLSLAIDVLLKSIEASTDPRGNPWHWFTFVPWHALAVAVAELCVSRSRDLVDVAWPVVEAAFRRYSARIADSNRGMLWRPLEKLMKKAREHRLDLLMAVDEMDTSAAELTQGEVGMDVSGGFKTAKFSPAGVENDWQYLPPSLATMDLSSTLSSFTLPVPPLHQQQPNPTTATQEQEMQNQLWPDPFYVLPQPYPQPQSQTQPQSQPQPQPQPQPQTQTQAATDQLPGVSWDQWDAFIADVGMDGAAGDGVAGAGFYGVEGGVDFLGGWV